MDRENDTPTPVEDAETPTLEADDADALEAEEAQPDDADAQDGDQDEPADDADADDQSNDDDQEADAQQAEAEESGKADGLVEIEFEGETFQVPEKLKGAFLMNRDYTQKTQAVAEERRTVGEIRQAIEEVGKMTHQEVTAQVQIAGAQEQLKSISDALDAYSNVDWSAWEMQDYDAYKRGENEYRALQAQERRTRAQIDQLARSVQEAGYKRQRALSEERTKRIAAVENFAKKNIPGWNTEMDAKIGDFLKNELQVDDAFMANNISPQLYRAGWLAYVGHQTLQRASQAKPKPAAKQIKPTSTVKAKTGPSARKSPSDMTMEEYAAHMNRKEAAARNRKYA